MDERFPILRYTQLHKSLTACADLDSEEADAIREEMDGCWRVLDDADRERVRQLVAKEEA